MSVVMVVAVDECWVRVLAVRTTRVCVATCGSSLHCAPRDSTPVRRSEAMVLALAGLNIALIVMPGEQYEGRREGWVITRIL